MKGLTLHTCRQDQPVLHLRYPVRQERAPVNHVSGRWQIWPARKATHRHHQLPRRSTRQRLEDSCPPSQPIASHPPVYIRPLTRDHTSFIAACTVQPPHSTSQPPAAATFLLKCPYSSLTPGSSAPGCRARAGLARVRAR